MPKSLLEVQSREPALELWGKPGPSAKDNYLAQLMARGNLIIPSLASGWTASHTGSGTSGVEAALRNVTTGATGSSVGLVYTYVYAMSVGGTTRAQINFDKDFDLFFGVAREVGGANTIARLQLKAATTEGVLGAKGIGIQISNLTLVGESYGTGLATTGSQVLTIDKRYQIRIKHTAGSKIEWWVDNVLLGTQSTAANIPSGTIADGAMVISVLNGATASDAQFYVSAMSGFQEL